MLVGAQFSLLAAQLLLRCRRSAWPRPTPIRFLGAAAMIAGVAVAAAGATNLGTGLTASPLPNAAAQLRTNGMYRWVRHPINSGLLPASAGRTLNSGDRRQLILSVALVVLLSYKSVYEERALRARFTGYGNYLQITPRFVPRARRSVRSGGSKRDAGVVRGRHRCGDLP